ncbi:MAG: ATP-binding cassette domain-containing protein [Acutalibacteraceae bacterium]
MQSISVSELYYKYASEQDFALQNIDFTLEAGDFCVICGKSGSGKSTLLKALAPQITENGDIYGDVLLFGESAFDISPKDAAQTVAFVGQSAESSIICEKVWQELAFGLESLSTDESEMHSRIAEVASYFGLQNCFENNVDTLSGGQKKILSIAAAMTLKPKILLLDEPLSSLDGKSVSELISILTRINRELGVTVIVAEHNFTELLGVCTYLLMLNGGKAEWFGKPKDIGEYISQSGDLSLLPTQLKVWNAALQSYPVTLSVADCKSTVADYCGKNNANEIIYDNAPNFTQIAAKVQNICYKYDKNEPFVTDSLSLTLHYGCITALLGENAAGKSTLLKLIYGSIKPQLGKITLYSQGGKPQKSQVAIMPQDVRIGFTHFSVYDELHAVTKDEKSLENAMSLCRLTELQCRNPMDLSGGEQKRLALALMLLSGADILLLDEPTSGLDREFCRELCDILKRLKTSGKAILITSHDMDFCAECANVCAFMFRGKITAISEPHRFFRQNMLYTTAAARIAGSSIANAVTDGELIYALCGKNDDKSGDIAHKIENNGDNSDNHGEINDKPHRKIKSESAKRHDKLSVIITAVCLCLIAPTVYLGFKIFGEQAFLAVSLCVILLAMLPFFVSFERSRPPAREIALLGVLTAAAVAARAAFYFLPQIKPVAAIVIITGFALGAGEGFLVGAMSMLLSNIFFGQGPWTPWQMLAMGLVGFAAGLVGKLKISRNPTAAAIFGFVATLVIYGGVVNPSTAILAHQPLKISVFALYYLQGLPMDIIHAASTFAFLLLFVSPFMKILSRIKLKFAIEA